MNPPFHFYALKVMNKKLLAKKNKSLDAAAGGEDLEGAEGDEEDDFGLLMEFFPGIKNFEPSDTAIASDSFFNPDFGLESQGIFLKTI